MNIITGYRGEPHITSDQDRDANQGSYGTGSYILDVGAKMAASIVSANEVRIAGGVLSHQGCLGNIAKGQYESCAIANGSQGMKRSDLIVCRYEKDTETNIESLSLVVIQGTPSSSTPSDPSYNSGDIQSGASPVDFPLYRVNINGVALSSITRLAPYVRTQNEIDTLIGNTSISGIGNGTLTGAVKALNDKTTLTLSTSSYFPTTYIFIKNGIWHLRCSGNMQQAITANASYIIATPSQIPEGLRPTATQALYVLGQNNTNVFRVEIASDGYIRLQCNADINAGVGVTIHVTCLW